MLLPGAAAWRCRLVLTSLAATAFRHRLLPPPTAQLGSAACCRFIAGLVLVLLLVLLLLVLLARLRP